jgi:RNA polymerase sigma-70 factor, ECF subfamily
MDEQVYIQAAVNGDIEAFNELVLIYQDLVYRHVFILTKDADNAADATQDTFIKAYLKIAQFRGGSFKAWLVRIGSNIVLDNLRQQKRRPLVPLLPQLDDDEEMESPQWLTDCSTMPETICDRRIFMQDLQKALDALPVHYRLVVNLIDIEGLDYQETAQALHLPLGTVKTRLMRARLLLRNLLSGDTVPYHEMPEDISADRDDPRKSVCSDDFKEQTFIA